MDQQQQQQSQQQKQQSESLHKIFDKEEFDPISYINDRFPDENSLINLDQEINMLKQELSTMNTELISSIHQHALLNTELKTEIITAHKTTQEVIKEIGVIKEKAEKSETLVYEMCKDIKQLDTAKKNLTFSITALKKFIMMLTAVEQLREYCKQRNYKEVSNLISAFDELSAYFKKYQQIQQINDLYKEKDDIIRELKTSLTEELKKYNRGTSLLQPQQMAASSHIIETLGQNYKNEIIGTICGLVLEGYQQTFHQPESQTIDNQQRRFTWLWRRMQEYDAKWTGIFPEYWGIHCYIIYEFCGTTRISTTDTLEKCYQKTDISAIMKALQETLNFEEKVSKDMQKRYDMFLNQQAGQLKEQGSGQWQQQIDEEKKAGEVNIQQIKQEKKDFAISRLPKFKGSISDSFEPYLKPYVEKEYSDMQQYIDKIIREDEEGFNAELKILTSSLYMFQYIKALIKRASSFSRTQTMLDIAKCIKKTLQYYLDQLGNSLLKQDKNKSQEENTFQQYTCYIIGTAEYCKETMSQLEESVKQYLDQPFCEQIQFNNEQDKCTALLNKGIELLINHLDQLLDPHFNSFIKVMNYGQLDMGEQPDTTNITKEVKLILNTHINQIKLIINEVYLIFYLNKIVVLLNNKFMNTVYKFKKFGIGAHPILMIDVTELENCLVSLGKMENESKSMMSYTNFVGKTFTKTKNILKLLSMPNESFNENLKNFFEDATNVDLEKILNLKGLKRIEVQGIIKYVTK